MLTETSDFLELDYNNIAKLLVSPELHIKSEIEVFNAANDWVSYSMNERKNFAKGLLEKVRLHLLSDHTLKHILNKTTSFTAINECVALLKKALASKNILDESKSTSKYKNRFCNQNKFNILVCSGYNYNMYLKVMYQVNGSNLNDVKVLPMTKERRLAESVCVKGEVYLLGGFDADQNWVASVDKYSTVTNDWNEVADLHDDRLWFCACSLMNTIFVIGGIGDGGRTSSCLALNIKDYKWKNIAEMKVARTSAACEVFEGNVIVAGGSGDGPVDVWGLKSVESYDITGNEWTPMPNMIKGKSGHCLVAVKNKLFVIATFKDGCEVFDNVCKKFVALKTSPIMSKVITANFFKAIAIGSKIVVFEEKRSSVKCYDVDKDEWCLEVCDVKKSLSQFCCVKVSSY